MKLSQLVAKLAPVSFEYDGETVNLAVRVQLITADLLADLQTIDNGTDTVKRARAIAEQVARLVASWDVEGEDGQPFPLDAVRLSSEVPVPFLMRALRTSLGAVGEAMAPGGTSGATSGAGS